jgi:ABC-2 type transport system ATP-binding protein
MSPTAPVTCSSRFVRPACSIASVSVAKPTLDEVFLAITGHDTGQTGDADVTTDDDPVLEVR